jgi:hypothetical protein
MRIQWVADRLARAPSLLKIFEIDHEIIIIIIIIITRRRNPGSLKMTKSFNVKCRVAPSWIHPCCCKLL